METRSLDLLNSGIITVTPRIKVFGYTALRVNYTITPGDFRMPAKTIDILVLAGGLIREYSEVAADPENKIKKIGFLNGDWSVTASEENLLECVCFRDFLKKNTEQGKKRTDTDRELWFACNPQ